MTQTSLENHFLQLFGIPESKVQDIISRFVREDFVKGDMFLVRDKKSERLSFIHEGVFRVYAHTDAKEVTQWIGHDGYFLTDLSSFLFESPSRWNIQAITSATVFSLYKKDYLEFEQYIPDWNILEKRFMAKCFMMIEDRVFSFLSQSAEERYDQYFQQNKALFNKVPLQYIASVLGMSPETLSRIRAKSTS